MKKFREYLEERKRTPQEAQKVVDYLVTRHKRRGKDLSKEELPFKSHRYPGDSDPNLDPEMFDYVGRKKVPIKQLKPGQPTFSHTGVSKYIHSKREGVGTAVKYPKDGIRLHDGHHGMVAAMARGDSHYEVDLYKPNKKWRPD